MKLRRLAEEASIPQQAQELTGGHGDSTEVQQSLRQGQQQADQAEKEAQQRLQPLQDQAEDKFEELEQGLVQGEQQQLAQTKNAGDLVSRLQAIFGDYLKTTGL